ncbi:hypothetical protein [Sporosarcina sp. FSL K6-3457]|uniref:hypothetical protein n=1 Tax=Sporosarcina sp. FSL K6-3457 TaxID=2978204 RepID=UPI0030F5FE8E
MEFLEKHNYKEIARKFKVEDLLDFFVAAAPEKWAGFRDGTEVMAYVGLIHLPHVKINNPII